MFPCGSISIFSEDGFAGKPGIVVIFPVIGTRNPAPAENLISRTVILNPSGLPNNSGLSDSEKGVRLEENGKQTFLHCLTVNRLRGWNY